MSTGHPSSLRLIADIGATNTRIAIAAPANPVPLAYWRYETKAFTDLKTPLQAALAQWSGPQPDEAICALASPVNGDEITLTNVGWSFSIQQTQQALNLDRLIVVNDWVAQAWAVTQLTGADCRELRGGVPNPRAPILVMGPGTGLGSAALIPHGKEWRAIACEGGHISFAPTNARESAIVRCIHGAHRHCSAERVASGLGISTIYAAICAVDAINPISEDPAAISVAAHQGNPQAKETFSLFSGALGSVVGDLALAIGARGGIYIGGGLLPAITTLFDQEAFLARSIAKGRFSNYLSRIPMWQIVSDNAALVGLATVPSQQANEF